MPTVIRIAGFIVVIRLPPREHGPPHVHVQKGRDSISVYLSPVALRCVEGMRDADVVRAVRIVDDHAEYLLHHWRIHHGA